MEELAAAPAEYRRRLAAGAGARAVSCGWRAALPMLRLGPQRPLLLRLALPLLLSLGLSLGLRPLLLLLLLLWLLSSLQLLCAPRQLPLLLLPLLLLQRFH